MSLAIWPPLPAEELKASIQETQKRELKWLLKELHDTLVSLKHGLEDCYALLAPIDPGNTLAVSTPRNEIVKGTITRIGTRIMKGALHLRLRTLPQQSFALRPENPIQIAPLANLHTLLTHSIDLLTLTLTHIHPPSPMASRSTNNPDDPTSLNLPHLGSAAFIAAQLELLSQSLADATAILRGPPLTESDPAWTTRSASPSHFDPALPPNVSFHLGVQDSQLVLWLRALEPADAPVNFGMKFALAIGTTRRLEHDEAEQIFEFHPPGEDKSSEVEKVLVREKVRVESADPSLLSLSAKLTALGHTLGLARGNLAAVMGVDFQD